MIEKLTLSRISSTDKKKDGTELKNKYGSFWRVGIQTKEHGDEWLNGFLKEAPVWQEGDVVELEVATEQWEKSNGEVVDQLKFRLPTAESRDKAKIKELEDKVANLEQF